VRQNLAMASSDPTSGGDGERDVFGSLPNARPQRRSAKRDRAGGTAKAAAPAPAKAKATAAKPKSAKPTAVKPAAAKPKAKQGPRATAKAKPSAAAPASKIPPAGYATPRSDDDGVPRGVDLVTTAVQAAGELAHIGLAAGGRALKSALERLPRP
jgi:hypothetical protein